MTSVKYKVEKFATQNDFGLWLFKMWALLVHQGVEEALWGKIALNAKLDEKEKKIFMDKVQSTIILRERNQEKQLAWEEEIKSIVWK